MSKECSFLNWLYQNNLDHSVAYRNFLCLPGEKIYTSFPLPERLGLTCLLQGSYSQPVILHEDVLVQAGDTVCIHIPHPNLSDALSLDLFCLSPDAGIACYFNSTDNIPIPLDLRGFFHIVAWNQASRIFLLNSTNSAVHVSITACEVASL